MLGEMKGTRRISGPLPTFGVIARLRLRPCKPLRRLDGGKRSLLDIMMNGVCCLLTCDGFAEIL